MSLIPEDLLFAPSHEWVRMEADGTACIGISDYAQFSLGDITFVQMPKPGAVLSAGKPFGVVESVKAASDLYAPVSGTVLAVNERLDTAPETVNAEPYAGGWLLRLGSVTPRDDLLGPSAYRKQIGEPE
jgi:glycine cleavage system H protein